ncbi:hypothetical protein VPH35_108741 [Triticum aestivum]
MAAWSPQRCRAMSAAASRARPVRVMGAHGTASGASGPREWTSSRRWTWLRRSRTCAAGARAGNAGTWGVRAKGKAVAETRRSRRTCVVAQRSRRLGAKIVEARGTEPRRSCRMRQACVWARAGRVRRGGTMV